MFVWLFVCVLSIYLAYDFSIKNTGFSPEQPIAFSHKKHSGEFGMKCLFCHYSAETSSFSNIPTTKSCIVCHIALKNESELMKPVNFSFDSNASIKYNRVYILPDYTHFDHSSHIKAQIDCSSCHGSVETMDSIKQVSVISMSWCLNCHREPAKYITKARSISGIITDSLPFKTADYTSVSRPEYGLWESRVPAKSIDGFYLPFMPVRGPETCSACHH